MPLVERSASFTPRPNLVIVRAGDGSVHNRWTRDIAEEARSWNLLVSFFGQDEAALVPPFEMLARQQGQKWPAMHQLLASGELPAFELVWCVDDDIACRWSDINRLFDTVADYGLDLAQPALDADSYVSHAITMAKPGRVLRYTSFVEVMCPVFSRAAFERCAPPMAEALLGWGLDFVWASLLGNPTDRIGVIDSVPVRHTRPVGRHYRMDDAYAEMRAMMERYGAARLMTAYGAPPVRQPRRPLPPG